jgi:hypothetical protein
MKRLIAIALTMIAASPTVALAQVSSSVPLAEVARKEQERRKTTKKATKVITNASLGADAEPAAAERPSASGAVAASQMPQQPAIPLSPEPEPEPGEVKNQAYWQKRIGEARGALQRAQTFADAMQTKINSLRADIVNLDYPARGVAEKNLNAALAELERLTKEITAQQKAIVAIEDEARRANVPAGWLRPQE